MFLPLNAYHYDALTPSPYAALLLPKAYSAVAGLKDAKHNLTEAKKAAEQKNRIKEIEAAAREIDHAIREIGIEWQDAKIAS
ncbi:MAG: hypothetical protein DME43_02965 [Verrucomicrobia bacterium]|nr:MAG: hypothetical protein DME43_02965 [Verrucomicrobiota bacterium]PYK72330.1 MAG: hypothetical protein DME44_04795 [Verrucomicrobiota bacterium]